MEAVDKLKLWLEKNPDGALYLSQELGYRTTSTIRMWVSRRSIPRHQVPQIIELIQRFNRKKKAQKKEMFSELTD